MSRYRTWLLAGYSATVLPMLAASHSRIYTPTAALNRVTDHDVLVKRPRLLSPPPSPPNPRAKESCVLYTV